MWMKTGSDVMNTLCKNISKTDVGWPYIGAKNLERGSIKKMEHTLKISTSIFQIHKMFWYAWCVCVCPYISAFTVCESQNFFYFFCFKTSCCFFSLLSPYLNDKIREVVSDCALPISVVVFSFIGSYLFIDIQREYKPHQWRKEVS